MQAGDFFVAHTEGPMGWLIGFGEKIDGAGKDAYWTHAGIVSDDYGATIEAQGRGIVEGNLANHKFYKVIDVGFSGRQREQEMAFARNCIGDKYGFLDIGSIAIDILTPNRIEFRTEGTLICSEFVAMCLEHAG